MSYSETVETGKNLMAWFNAHSVETIVVFAVLLFIIAIINSFRKK